MLTASLAFQQTVKGNEPVTNSFNVIPEEDGYLLKCADNPEVSLAREDKPLRADFQPRLYAIRLKDTTKNESLFFQTKAGQWIKKEASNYFRCGYPIDIEQVKKSIKKFNKEFLENAPRLDVEKDTDLYGASAIYEPISSVEQNGMLVLHIVRKVIQDIRVLSRCNDSGENRLITEIRETLPIRGQKPDALVLRALGFVSGDRYPEYMEEQAASGRVAALGVFRQFTFVITPGSDISKVNLLVCGAQKKEAELVLEEAESINTRVSVEAAKRAISKYQEALSLFKAFNSFQSKINNISIQKTNIVILALPQGYFLQRRFDFETDVQLGIANAYASIGESYQALHYYTQVLPKFRALGKKDEELAALTAIADIYNDMSDQQNAYRYYREALSILLEKRKLAQSGATK